MNLLNLLKQRLVMLSMLILAGNISFAQTDSLAAKAKRLKILYNLSINSANGDIYKERFFAEFPNTFKQLNELYGYVDKKQGPLYQDAIGHIYELFNHLDIINDTLYYKKLIGISINGYWDADAVNYFVDGLRKRVLSKTALTVYLLSNKTDEDIINFWTFYFDYENSYIRKRNYDQIINQLPLNNKRMATLISTGYNKATKDWKDNH